MQTDVADHLRRGALMVAPGAWKRESVVVAAWGPRSDWYRNVLSGGAARVRTAGARYTPDYRVLAEEEARGLLAAYERRNRAAVKLFRRLLRLRPDEPFPDLGSRMPLVAFRPRVPPVRSERPNARGRDPSVDSCHFAVRAATIVVEDLDEVRDHRGRS